jgi:hypothetical protein
VEKLLSEPYVGSEEREMILVSVYPASGTERVSGTFSKLNFPVFVKSTLRFAVSLTRYEDLSMMSARVASFVNTRLAGNPSLVSSDWV